MAKKRKQAKPKTNSATLDSIYLFKIILFLILGSQWLYVIPNNGSQIPLPIGVIIGALFASHEHFSIDRKIEYAILLVAMFIGFWLPMGLTISI